ncbi:MAG TPA: CorA family divalent cation transporter [Thermoplasmata archaeon]|nr:CorA family divalent cation transporter [Thermoplasmata archaeon]
MTSRSSPSTGSAGDSRDTSLPRSIFVPDRDPRRPAREAVNAILSDAFMAFISLLLIPIILVPFFVNLPSTILLIFDWGDVTIILFFVAEYSSKIYLAADRWEYFRSPWHLLDLSVILLSFVSYVPIFGLAGKGSVLLLVRLLRLPRVFAVAGRTAGSRLGPEEAKEEVLAPEPEAVIREVDPGRLSDVHVLSWEELEKHLGTDDEEWIHISNFSDEALLRLSAILEVPGHHFRLDQVDDLWPHIGRVERTVLLFLQSGEIQYPQQTREFYTIARRGAIVVVQGPKVISVSPHGLDPFPEVTSWLRSSAATGKTFSLRVIEGLLTTTLREYRGLFSEIELEVGAITRTPRSRLPKDFLARMYELQKTITRFSSNLVHFRELVNRLTSGRVPLEGIDEPAKSRFEALADETSFLSEIARDASENVGTVIDVYINQSSFETNRILKILAVITAVAIIPATIGGLLGISGPYIFELWQIVLIVVLSMIFVTYCFLKLGWLRT